jgi:polyisoprenoid-binding protein YceI
MRSCDGETGIASAAPSDMTTPSTMSTTPRVNLKSSMQSLMSRDHERLERAFKDFVDVSRQRNDRADLRSEWASFECQLLAHLHAEEVSVFPAFVQSHAQEAQQLLDEHARIREQLTELGVELDLHCLGADRVDGFAASLRAHAAAEEETLGRWAAGQVGPTEHDQWRRALAASGDKTAHARAWQIDLERSSLTFSLRHIVIHEIRGRFTRWGGAVSIDESDLAMSTLRIWVDLASVETGDSERDDHVRSSEFFAVERFPRAIFLSTDIRGGSGEGNAAVRGRLRLHGCEADIDLQVTKGDLTSDPSVTERAIYSVTGRIDRRTFGLRWNQDLDFGGVVVGDQIHIAARVELVRRVS